MGTPDEARQRDVILDSIADGVFTVDENWCITSFNRAAEQITGVSRAEAVGRRCCDVFRASICESTCALKHTLETGRPVVDKAIYIVSADGRRIPNSATLAAAVRSSTRKTPSRRSRARSASSRRGAPGRFTSSTACSTSARPGRSR